jgi:hypothetical protein
MIFVVVGMDALLSDMCLVNAVSQAVLGQLGCCWEESKPEAYAEMLSL